MAVKAKGTWGKRDPRTAKELDAIYNEFFEKLVVPDDWKFMQWSNVFDSALISEANPNGTLISVGKIYRDMRTSGIDLKDYRVYFLTYSERGGIVEKTIIDFGKYKRKCVVNNKSVEKLNEWIKEHYNELQEKESNNPSAALIPLQGDIDEDDGLQHFRDRFGDRVVDKMGQ